MKEIIIIYDNLNGAVVPDGKVEEFIDSVISSNDTEVVIGCESIMLGFQLRHRHSQVKIKHVLHKDHNNDQDVLICLKKDGLLDSHPSGFCDYNENCHHILAGWGPLK